MSKYWFKAKRYGFGTYPTAWEGWLATLCLVVLILISFYINILITEEGLQATLKDWLRYGLDVFILAALFLVMFKDKVEGGLKWRWSKE